MADIGIAGQQTEPSESFSLARGGAFERFLERGRIVGDGSLRPMRAAFLLLVVTWAPLLLLSIAAGTAWGTSVQIPFALDLVSQVRLLVALPLVIYAESVVDPRLGTVVSFLRDGGLVSARAMEGFDEAFGSLSRSRASRATELGVLALVIAGIVLLLAGPGRARLALDLTTWWLTGPAGDKQLTAAGWWYGLVSVPVFQFIFALWAWRMALWGRFLWKVSRLELALVPAHPDRVGGLGFLYAGQSSFTVIFVAIGAVFSATIGNQILHEGRRLAEFQTEIAFFIAVCAALVIGPLVLFAPSLAAAKRTARPKYSLLGNRLARQFDAEWVEAPRAEGLTESPLVSALADFGASFSAVSEMRALPVDARGAMQLLVTLALPFIPLLLTEMSAREVAQGLMKVLL